MGNFQALEFGLFPRMGEKRQNDGSGENAEQNDQKSGRERFHVANFYDLITPKMAQLPCHGKPNRIAWDRKSSRMSERSANGTFRPIRVV